MAARLRILAMKGVMGSRSGATRSCMRASRIMKFVAAVSSSISSVLVPTSSACLHARMGYVTEQWQHNSLASKKPSPWHASHWPLTISLTICSRAC